MSAAATSIAQIAPYTVRNMHGALIEARLLPPGSDLKRAFVVAMVEWIDAGWALGEFTSVAGVFFCTKGVERRQGEITPTGPGSRQTYRALHLSASTGNDE